MAAVTKIMMLSSNEKESLQDYYHRTMRSLATQSSLGYKIDAEIDQATDFTYMLDRKTIQTMITNMDWIEESEIRKFQTALRADPTLVHVTTYPANLAEAFQRANSYQLGHEKTTTGTVADNLLQTVLASDVSSDPRNKKHKDGRKTIPREEWLIMTKERQDAVKAKNKARPKCEYCNKPGHTKSECRTLKSAIAELKKENAKKSVAFTTATQAEVGEDEEELFEAAYVHSTETVMHNQYNTLCENLVLSDHCASASIFRNKNLLTNLRPSGTITFTGIGGSIDVTQQGDFRVFGTVAHDERATFNVISVDSPPKSSVVTYNHAARYHTIIIQGEVFDFKVPYGKKGLLVRRFSHAFPSPHTHILVNTIAQNESLYSKREVDEAKQARKISRMLAIPSFKDISGAISSGTLIDCPVTIQSLKRAIDIYGMQDNNTYDNAT